MQPYLHVRVVGDARIEVDTNLNKATDFQRWMAGRGITTATEQLGIDLGLGDDMHKAVKPMGEAPDPRLGELVTLIEHARESWDQYGQQLTEKVVELLEAGKLLPLTPKNEQALRALFDDHRVTLLLELQGAEAAGRAKLRALQRAGLVSPEIVKAGGYTEIAYRLGRGLDLLKLHERKVNRPSLEQALEAALRTDLDEEDVRAIGYAQRQAGEYIRRPIRQSLTRTHRLLWNHELASIREGMADYVENPQEEPLKRRLRRAVKATSLTNDLDRIARTELQYAHGWGAYRKLKVQAQEELGEDDPKVYRLASVNACRHCLRIWGPPSQPIPYRLSELERHEARGGNFGVPAAQWGPTIGPVHPNCACAPIAYYDEQMAPAIAAAAQEVLDTFGPW